LLCRRIERRRADTRHTFQQIEINRVIMATTLARYVV
jgi:hypothetical protein